MKRRLGNRYSSIKNQRGVAGIWLGMTLVPIMGFTFWAIEGTRYVQEHNRLGDANEAAAMALTIQDDTASAQNLAESYIRSYVRDIDSIAVTSVRQHQEQTDASDESIQYSVSAVTSHSSWFSSTFIPSFNETVDLHSSAVAKKYLSTLADNNIDIVFVADFSGSMTYSWSGSSNSKIKDLKLAINQVSAKILCGNIGYKEVGGKLVEVCLDSDQDKMANKLDNRIALAPFNTRTRERDSQNTAYAVSQLRYRKDVKIGEPSLTYDEVDWNWWRTKNFKYVHLCSNNHKKCDGKSLSLQKQAKRIVDVLGIYKWKSNYYGSKYLDEPNYIDYQKTVSDMLNDKFPGQSSNYQVKSTNLYGGFGSKSNDQFFNVPLTSQLTEINKINKMEASGATAAYQGILTGVQLLSQGNPNSSDSEEQEAYDSKIKMLLIFSDGEESPDPKILKNLVSAKMCDTARQYIPGLYIGFIGVDFDAENIPAFRQCVNDETTDIINVGNLNELIEKIEELIKNGSKSSGFTKLY
ncbi:TadE/TadG family type IV pilus assembly protein [Vibrio maritimus]|uniref:TadE/TadG family type IV pilus assembly protein n=1 Tax=Vibrio maritimus TaxID=990268 RepID=UPI001F259092|nr:TadE/TadG family type IV pilus assembly protein [Vibrio maritimus]